MDELFDLEIDLDMDENLVNQLPIIDQKIIYYLVEEAIGSARKRNGSTHLTLILTKHDTQVAQLMIEDCADTAKKMEFPFQSAEMDNIQEFSELIGGSVGVLGGGQRFKSYFRSPGSLGMESSPNCEQRVEIEKKIGAENIRLPAWDYCINLADNRRREHDRCSRHLWRDLHLGCFLGVGQTC